MNKIEEQKQIDEMAKDICHSPNCDIKQNGSACYKYCKAYIYAFRAVNASYRKQREGKWMFHKDGSGTCNQCGTTQKNIWDMDNYQSYCGHCGARMKGEKEDG